MVDQRDTFEAAKMLIEDEDPYADEEVCLRVMEKFGGKEYADSVRRHINLLLNRKDTKHQVKLYKDKEDNL